MTAIKQKKLFVLDYHDLLLPYVSKVRQLKGTTLYGSRTLFFLTPDGTLRPVAIELTRPLMDGKPQWREVFTPTSHATGCWLWRLAKAHVLAHDSGVHQLVSHWLRTHCCTEPYIIAANRQLSAMHPIYKLLHPHFRYTMEINALARGYLINADGVIESCFSPGKYSIELSSVAYDQLWQFDLQALPNDLINSLKEWVTDYVNHYYKDSSLVQSDQELQAWWAEVRNVGHGDKRDAAGWPELKTTDDLIQIITTIVWVTSGHHAACFPSQMQATKVMAVLDVLSNHSSDEEYLGENAEPAWKEDPIINAAFERFNGRLKEIEGTIDARNQDMKLKNRNGAGVLPYELLKPFSKSGVTGQGVPYSISI
ncbi:hypothetical protein CRG98_018528 [Punica granatum]|uniref:Lipoxygenase domain-containing protein n=1 Tax=Punica granatum TaxID=22663 RepID=A0A2I0JZ40_PUNGR|nr:hypothetical protein CRG98_018528 [Punica granatum]